MVYNGFQNGIEGETGNLQIDFPALVIVLIDNSKPQTEEYWSIDKWSSGYI